MPHLDGKWLRGPQFWIRWPLRAAIWKNMPHFAQNLAIFDHFLSSNVQNLQFCRFKRDLRAALRPLAGHMRPTGRVFETPGIYHIIMKYWWHPNLCTFITWVKQARKMILRQNYLLNCGHFCSNIAPIRLIHGSTFTQVYAIFDVKSECWK